MSRPRDAKCLPIELDLSSALDHTRNLGRADLLALAPQLELARRGLIERAAGDDRHWLDWPRRLLEDHEAKRARGVLSGWLAAAKALRGSVDRAVILGSTASIEILQAIFAACCHPYHNELPRGERGGRPRIDLVSTSADNDALQGLLDLLPQGRVLDDEEERWGLVAIDDGAENELLSPMFQLLWDTLLGTAQPGDEAARALVVGEPDSPLVQFADQADCPSLPSFVPLPLRGAENVAAQENDPAAMATFNPYHPGILLAAAVMNVDVVQYLLGAVATTDRFRTAPPGDNAALDLAGCQYLWRERAGIRDLFVEGPTGLAPLARWWSVCRSHKPGLLVQWRPTAVRRDRLRITLPAGQAPSGRKKTIERYLPDVAELQAEQVRAARTAEGLPTSVIKLPTVDEATLGQLVQLRMMLAEGCLHFPR